MKDRFHKQLTLNLILQDYVGWENFYPGSNQKQVQLLQSWNKDTRNQFVYFWGAPGTGRSHLAIATCREMGKLGLPIVYLPLRDQKNLSPKILENLEHVFLLCLDDLDMVLGKHGWEEALFDCFNRLLEAGGNLLITANSSPRGLNFILPDLKSRLTSCLIFKLRPLTHEQKIKALHLRAKQRGLKLPNQTSQFLLNHYQRDLKILFTLLEKLSQAALQMKRPLTIPFVKEILGE
jgi:DnaA-homolog protein